MEHTFFTIDEKACNELAHEIFMKTSGINKEGRKFQRMQENAFRMRDEIEDNVRIRAAYVYYEDVRLEENTAHIGDQTFRCSAFRQIEPDSIKGAYIYALSAGDYGFPEENIMDQLYADIWGTAFTEAARLMLKKQLEREAKLSDSFGPGFYGMDVSAMEQVAALIDFKALDIELRSSRILLPLKSCAGLYFSVSDDYRKLNRSCQDCQGTYTSCQLCQINKGE